MSPGAKLFLTIAGVGGVLGVLALAASKKASASPGTVIVPPHDGAPPDKIPNDPNEGGFVRDSPFSVPGIQDAQEAQRNLLRWWSVEGIALAGADKSVAEQRAEGIPQDFGSQQGDLSGNWTDRTKAIAKQFEYYSGLSPEDGELDNQLVLALRRWAKSQELAPSAPTVDPSTPAPIVLPAPVLPPQGGAPPMVPLPPIVPQAPVVPVSPLPPEAGQAPPQAPVAPAPVMQEPLPPIPSSPPPIVPLPPIVPPAAAPAAPPVPTTTVRRDTGDMVNALLMAERSNGWNTTDPSVQAWQKARGLVVDGKFGPTSALTVAQEFGTVPIIRFWPKGSQKAKALQDYRASLIEIANNAAQAGDATRAEQLRVSAQREQGQSFGVKEKKASALPQSLQVGLAKVA